VSIIHNSAVAAFAELDSRDISLVYRGKSGCACGCRGNYSDAPRSVTRARNDIRRWIESGEATDIMVSPGVFVSVENAKGRVCTVYTDGRGKLYGRLRQV